MSRAMMMAALVSAFAAMAEDEVETAEAVANAVAVPGAPSAATPRGAFTTLPLCRRIEGLASVRKPGGEWEAAEEGRFYPFGASFRAEKGGSLVLAFGPDATATISDGSEFGTRPQVIGVTVRTIVLVRGTIELKMPDNLREGMFFLTAPGFTIRNPAGVATIAYEDKGDGDEATVFCKTGSLGIEGRHFDIPTMRAADEIRIRTSRDHLFTSLYGTSGNYVVNLDQGVCSREEFDDEGNLKNVVEKGILAWHLSPRTQVIINRSVPALGERMSVHVMTFDATGVLQNERAFSEGRVEVNSGELVIKEAATSAEELAKRAAEMTETTAAANDTADAPAEESKSGE